MALSVPVVTVTLNPAIDYTLSIPVFSVGEVNRVNAIRTQAGGKGVNVAAFLSDLGVSVIATGFLGEDNAELFEDLFQERGIEDRFVRISGSTRIGVKVVDETKQQTTDINLPGLTPRPEAIEQLFQEIAALLKPGRWFALCGSVPQGIEGDVYARLTRLIRAGGGHVALDTSQQPLRDAIDCGPDFVKPNVAELEQLVCRPLVTLRDVAGAALMLQRSGVGLVVVSMGKQGAVFVDSETILVARPPRVSPGSTAGAGDAMVSGVLYAQMKQLTLHECARLATSLGTCVVTRQGASLDLALVEIYREQVIIEAMSAAEAMQDQLF